VTSLVILVLNLASGVVVARGLGPESRGDLAVALLWPTLIAGFGGLGIQEAVSYFSGREETGAPRILASALCIGAAQTALMAPAAYLLLPLVLHQEPARVLKESVFYLWILPLYPLTLYPVALLQGRLELRAFNVTRISAHAVYAILLALLWSSHRLTVHSAVAVSLLAYFGYFLLGFGVVVARRHWTWRPDHRLVKELLSFGFKLHLGNVATIATQRLDLLVLSFVVSSAALGSYVIATSMGLVAILLPTAASMVLYPIFSRLEPDRFSLYLSRVLLCGTVLTLVLSPLIAVLPSCVALVFGPAFSRATPLTWVLAPAYATRGWNLILTAILRGVGRPVLASVCQTVELSVLACALVALTPRSRTMGAAFAVLTGALVALFALLAVSCRAAKLSPGVAVHLWSNDIRRLHSHLLSGEWYC
jgi:O-antigen/teichoic acid export membrane protein